MNQIQPDMILGFATVRNEAMRLPYWLDHHRRLGVGHFLIVDNGSNDGTAAFLATQPDVSVWHTDHSYKRSRFGMDWMNWLLLRYGHGHWCLTCDADELMVIPYSETRDLTALTKWLDETGQRNYGALMLDLYPREALSKAQYIPGQNPTDVIPFFDGGNYVMHRQERLQNLWIQGGARARVFFSDDPRRAPTLSKVPLIKWHRRYAYVSSTHTVLPRHLNHVYAVDGSEKPSGVLLHTKFLSTAVTKSSEEKFRREHFANSSLYDAYYDAVEADPVLWCAHSMRYRGWRHLEALGFMSRGGWS